MPKNKLPTSGSIGIGEGSCFRIDVPRHPTAPVKLVKTALHNGTATTLTLMIERERLLRAIERGTIVVIPKRSLAQTPQVVPPRPYPFEAARTRARMRRDRFWQRADVIALKRRGLLMAGDEYARLHAARTARDKPAGDDTHRVD